MTAEQQKDIILILELLSKDLDRLSKDVKLLSKFISIENNETNLRSAINGTD